MGASCGKPVPSGRESLVGTWIGYTDQGAMRLLVLYAHGVYQLVQMPGQASRCCCITQYSDDAVGCCDCCGQPSCCGFQLSRPHIEDNQWVMTVNGVKMVKAGPAPAQHQKPQHCNLRNALSSALPPHPTGISHHSYTVAGIPVVVADQTPASTAVAICAQPMAPPPPVTISSCS